MPLMFFFFKKKIYLFIYFKCVFVFLLWTISEIFFCIIHFAMVEEVFRSFIQVQVAIPHSNTPSPALNMLHDIKYLSIINKIYLEKIYL